MKKCPILISGRTHRPERAFFFGWVLSLVGQNTCSNITTIGLESQAVCVLIDRAMESKQEFIRHAQRHQFDLALIPEGYNQLDSKQDAPWFGTWFKPETLELVNFSAGYMTKTVFQSEVEFVDWVVQERDEHQFTQLDDWSEDWRVRIEKTELHLYLDWVRNNRSAPPTGIGGAPGSA